MKCTCQDKWPVMDQSFMFYLQFEQEQEQMLKLISRLPVQLNLILCQDYHICHIFEQIQSYNTKDSGHNQTVAMIVKYRFILLIMSRLIMDSFNTKIPCQFVSSKWPTNIYHRLSARQLIVSTRYNFEMIVDIIDQSVSKSIIERGVWESNEVHVIANFIKPGSKILNLGPQTGLEAIIMGKIIGQKGKMHIVQPYSTSYSLVKKNIFLNDLEDITHLYKVGASDVQSQEKMLIFTQNTGGAQIFNFNNFPTDLSQRQYYQEIVQVDLIDNIIPSNQIIDFVLMDVQKMQVQALLGMKKLIQRSRQIVMMVEWQYEVNSHRNQQKTIRCINWLLDLGFKFYEHIQNLGNKCDIGKFKQILNPMHLLILAPTDIIIAPLTHQSQSNQLIVYIDTLQIYRINYLFQTHLIISQLLNLQPYISQSWRPYLLKAKQEIQFSNLFENTGFIYFVLTSMQQFQFLQVPIILLPDRLILYFILSCSGIYGPIYLAIVLLIQYYFILYLSAYRTVFSNTEERCFLSPDRMRQAELLQLQNISLVSLTIYRSQNSYVGISSLYILFNCSALLVKSNLLSACRQEVDTLRSNILTSPSAQPATIISL